LASIEGSPARPASAPRPLPAADTLDVVICGRVTRTDIAALCERARVLLEASDADLVAVDLGVTVDADAATVDALARLHLTARRLGKRIRFRHACRGVRELVDLMGLGVVLGLDVGSRLEPGRQAEQREQARGVEEEADP
jgi:ABC-type transporter Mla MlaB component